MAEQYFAAKDKDMMSPKAKKAVKGAVKKVFVLPRKGQKEYEDVERMGRKVKRVIEVPMKAKDVIMTKEKRVYSKAEKAMLTKAANKLQGLVKKRAERAEARAFKPLTLEEQNIKKQLEEKLQKGIEAAKSPEQKKMEKEMLLALEAPSATKIMAIEAPKGKAGRPVAYNEAPEIEGVVETKYVNTSLKELRKMAKDRGISQTGSKSDLQIKLIKDDRRSGNMPYSKKALEMSRLQEKQEPLITEIEESKDEPIVNAAAEVVADVTGAPEIKEQAAIKMQSAFRGMLGRRKVKEMKAQEEAMKAQEEAMKAQEEALKAQEEAKKQKKIFKTKGEIQSLKASAALDELKKYGMSAVSGNQARSILKRKLEKGEIGKGLAGSGMAANFLGHILHGLNKIPNYNKDEKGVKGGILGLLKGLASKAIEHISKNPIESIKQAVNIGKQAFEHGQKAKEMYDKFFKKDKAKGGMLEGFTEPEKRIMVHKIYHMNLFNKMMD